MPKALKEFPKVSREGRKPKHPYSQWFDAAAKGNGIELVMGEDFKDCTVRTARHNIYRVANKEELKIETRTVKNEDGDEVGLALRVLVPEKETSKK